MKICHFSLYSLKGFALIRQITNNECLRGNATRISQYLSILVSNDPYCYLSSKKLVWLNLLLKFDVFKFSYISAFFQKILNLTYDLSIIPRIGVTSSTKKMTPEQKTPIVWSQYYLWQKSLFVNFLILKIPDPWWNPDFTKFLPVMHFQI